MAQNEIITDADARKELKAGIDLVANLVKKTLGPRGRNVVLDTNPYDSPTNTNDGVTIAREVHAPKDRPHQETGVKIAKAVANKTNDVAGDGTTTSLVLLQSVVQHAHKQINNDADPVLLGRGITAAGNAIADELQKEVTETKDVAALTNVATISSGDPVIGKLVATAVEKVGENGVVTIEDSENEETTVRIAEGIELRGGVQLPIFLNQQTQKAVLEKVVIFVTDHDFTNGLEIVRIMEAVAEKGGKSAVLIANSVQGEAMASCVINWSQGKFKLLPIKIQALGEQGQAVMRDMAAATGARFYARDEGNRLPSNPQDKNDGFNIEDFGFAESVIASKDRTTIVDGGGAAEDRVKELQAQLEISKKAFDRNMIEERIARLQRGVGVVAVGGVTEAERKERKLRVEDAINAAKAALKSGIIAGGGASLYRAAHNVAIPPEHFSDDEKSGYLSVVRACKEPINQMAVNSSLVIDSSKLVQLIQDKNSTIDFNTGEVVNAVDSGIIDPALVTISAVRNVASEAALNAITDGVITRSEDDSEKI